MLAAGLIDEVSVLIAAVADGRIGTPAAFDIEEAAGFATRCLALTPSSASRMTFSGSATA
jgi:hypothetical protein